jgi:hypothetical protein
MPDTGQPLPPVTASVLRAAQALARFGQLPTLGRIADRLGVSRSTAQDCRNRLLKAGFWPWPKGEKRGPGIQYSDKPPFREGGKVKTPNALKPPRETGKRVGRWPRIDRERIERELAEWREKAGIWLHPA